MGLFIDTSCNEIVYYHTITSSVLQWTLSLYICDVHIKNVIKTILDDMGRIRDEDIQFILEKYRYNEEQRMAGRSIDDSTSGIDKLLTFLKPKKFDPETSYFSYYTHSVMLKLARSLLRNSAFFLNGDAFNIGSSTPDSGTPPPGDSDLYEEYTRNKDGLSRIVEAESLEKLQHALKRGTVDSAGRPMREPPEDIETAFDQPYLASDYDEELEEEGDHHREHNVRLKRRASNSPPRTQEDLEVEAIFKNYDDEQVSSDEAWSERNGDMYDDRTKQQAVVESPDSASQFFDTNKEEDGRLVSFNGNSYDDGYGRMMPFSGNADEGYTDMIPFSDSSDEADDGCVIPYGSEHAVGTRRRVVQPHLDSKVNNTTKTLSNAVTNTSLPVLNTCTFSRIETTKKIKLNGQLQLLLEQNKRLRQQQHIRSVTSGDEYTLESRMVKSYATTTSSSEIPIDVGVFNSSIHRPIPVPSDLRPVGYHKPKDKDHITSIVEEIV